MVSKLFFDAAMRTGELLDEAMWLLYEAKEEIREHYGKDNAVYIKISKFLENINEK